VKRFRGGLVFKAHRLLYHSTLGLRVLKKKKKKKKKRIAPACLRARFRYHFLVPPSLFWFLYYGSSITFSLSLTHSGSLSLSLSLSLACELQGCFRCHFLLLACGRPIFVSVVLASSFCSFSRQKLKCLYQETGKSTYGIRK